MPATSPSLSAVAEERAAWADLEAAEKALERFLANKSDCMPEVCGTIYYLEGDRLLCAPANVDGTPDRENSRHRTEYEGMAAEDMHQIAKAIGDWLSSQG